MHHARTFGADVDKRAKLLDPDNLAGQYLPKFYLVPRHARRADHRQVDSALGLIHVTHPHGNLVAFFDDICDVSDMISAELRNVEQAISPDADIDKGAVKLDLLYLTGQFHLGFQIRD